ncbi:MAG TPA: serine hydrolase domain-containing protein [Planctomycetota bacterium]|nr:serine hydrolase domain-containing protein [Planctomycetota bacterium]
MTALLTTFVFLASARPAQDSRPSLGDAVDRLFATWSRSDSPGCAVAVARDGKTLHARGYGMADLEHGAPITPRSVFEIGSCSKQFTAMAIALLEERGRLSLDDDVRRHVPELPDFGAPITLRHLLHHTSGLREHWFLDELAGWRWQDVATWSDLLQLTCRQRSLNFAPGTRHAYSNTGYGLLAEVVRRVSGEPLSKFLAREVFDPLGMSSTHVHDDRTRVVANRAVSHHPRDGGSFALSLPNVESVGDGNVYSTAEDLLLWLRNFDEPRVGNAHVMQTLLTPGTLSNGERLTYAGGLRIGEHRGHHLVSHAGADFGYRAQVMWFPDEHLSVVCIANLSSIDVEDLARSVADVALGVAEPESRAAEPSRDALMKGAAEARAYAQEHAVEVPAAELAPLAGTYLDLGSGETKTVRLEGSRLLLRAPGGRDVPLAPIGPSRFLVLGATTKLEVSFAGEKGTRTLAFGEMGGHRKDFALLAPRESASLAELAGTYASDEVGVTWNVVADGGALAIRRPRFDDLKLSPVCADTFHDDWLGTVHFLRDGAGKAVAFEIGNRVRGVERIEFRRR